MKLYAASSSKVAELSDYISNEKFDKYRSSLGTYVVIGLCQDAANSEFGIRLLYVGNAADVMYRRSLDNMLFPAPDYLPEQIKPSSPYVLVYALKPNITPIEFYEKAKQQILQRSG